MIMRLSLLLHACGHNFTQLAVCIYPYQSHQYHTSTARVPISSVSYIDIYYIVVGHIRVHSIRFRRTLAVSLSVTDVRHIGVVSILSVSHRCRFDVGSVAVSYRCLSVSVSYRYRFRIGMSVSFVSCRYRIGVYPSSPYPSYSCLCRVLSRESVTSVPYPYQIRVYHIRVERSYL